MGEMDGNQEPMRQRGATGGGVVGGLGGQIKTFFICETKHKL